MIDFVLGLKIEAGDDSFAVDIAKRLGVEYRGVVPEFYADGEPCPRILAPYEELKKKRVLYVSRLSAPTNSKDILTYLHTQERVAGMLSDNLLYNAYSVDVCDPYPLLARQDKNPRFSGKESVKKNDMGKDVGFKSMLLNLAVRKVDRLLTFYPHNMRDVTGSWQNYVGLPHSIDVEILDAVKPLAHYFKETAGPDAAVASPDKKAELLAKGVCSLTGLRSLGRLDKTRISDREVVTHGFIDAEGADVIPIDDIGSTNATMGGAMKNVRNARSFTPCFVHAPMPKVPGSEAKGYALAQTWLLDGYVKGIVSTNSIVNPLATQVDLVPQIIDFYHTHQV